MNWDSEAEDVEDGEYVEANTSRAAARNRIDSPRSPPESIYCVKDLNLEALAEAPARDEEVTSVLHKSSSARFPTESLRSPPKVKMSKSKSPSSSCRSSPKSQHTSPTMHQEKRETKSFEGKGAKGSLKNQL